MPGEVMIGGWRCYVSGDQLRHAESNGGFTVQVDKHGGVAGDNCYCPPAVVAWLFEPIRAQLRASEAEVARLTRELEELDLRRHELCNLLELDAKSPWAIVIADVKSELSVKTELLGKESEDD